MTVVFVIIITILIATFNLIADDEWLSQDWRMRNWFIHHEKNINEFIINWASVDNWKLLSYYINAIYTELWFYNKWDSISLLFRLWVYLDKSKLTRSE